MDGIHDLGGKHGHGQVAPQPLPAGFAERWHAVVFALMRATRGNAWFNTDQFRHAVERIDPAAYLTHGYYGRWLGAIETLLVEAGAMTLAQIDERVARIDAQPVASAARPQSDIERPAVSAPAHAARPVNAPPRFRAGDRVRTRRFATGGHTRLPAYARDRIGTVVAHHGGWVFPDTNAHGRGEGPQHLYTVAFDSTELWADAGERDVSVRLDLFEAYLAGAGEGEGGKEGGADEDE